MPVYEYGCECGNKADRFVRTITIEEPKPAIKCEECEGEMALQFSLNGPVGFGFKPYVTKHITGKGIFVGSAAEERKLEKKHNVARVS